MSENKKKFAVWLMPETKELVECHYAADNCKSQSEFIEKAIQFYIGYLHTNNACTFLPEAIASVLIGTLDNFGQRVSTQLHKVALEQNMCNHILIADTDMDERDYQLLRGRCLREVQSTNGRISFKDVLDFQKTV